MNNKITEIDKYTEIDELLAQLLEFKKIENYYNKEDNKVLKELIKQDREVTLPDMKSQFLNQFFEYKTNNILLYPDILYDLRRERYYKFEIPFCFYGQADVPQYQPGPISDDSQDQFFPFENESVSNYDMLYINKISFMVSNVNLGEDFYFYVIKGDYRELSTSTSRLIYYAYVSANDKEFTYYTRISDPVNFIYPSDSLPITVYYASPFTDKEAQVTWRLECFLYKEINQKTYQKYINNLKKLLTFEGL
ncbi:MAG: hypothetical protein ACTSRP_15675 [Candidatus Helarchaeota archaeon]